MRRHTKKILSELIVRYMKENKIRFYSEVNPFPVSFKTICSILKSDRDQTNIRFSTKTQEKLLNFFNIKHDRDGSDLIII